MSKVILEFDGIEEQEEIQSALNGWKWKSFVWDLDQKLRSTVKYGTSIIDDSKLATNDEVEIADKYREIIREMLHDSGLKLD